MSIVPETDDEENTENSGKFTDIFLSMLSLLTYLITVHINTSFIIMFLLTLLAYLIALFLFKVSISNTNAACPSRDKDVYEPSSDSNDSGQLIY